MAVEFYPAFEVTLLMHQQNFNFDSLMNVEMEGRGVVSGLGVEIITWWLCAEWNREEWDIKRTRESEGIDGREGEMVKYKEAAIVMFLPARHSCFEPLALILMPGGEYGNLLNIIPSQYNPQMSASNVSALHTSHQDSLNFSCCSVAMALRCGTAGRL